MHGSSALRGYVASYSRAATLGALGDTSQSRYALVSGATGVSSAAQRNTSPQAVRDANSKMRVIALGDTQYLVAAVSSTLTVGPRVILVENIGTSSSSTVLGDVSLSNEGITSLPSASTLASSAVWDVVYDSQDNKAWFYYFDTSNSRRLMRIGVDLNTRLADQSEVEVNATVGATGATQLALRAHRGMMKGDQVLISVANKTAGGSHSTIYVTDQFNLAPLAPTLTPSGNFDATLDKVFAWTFNDPNVIDSQSAYQLQINTSIGASAVDTGKVTSSNTSYTVTGGTLSNPGSWQWRVKTWDAADTEGAWSAFVAFTTDVGGTVTITTPASDNPTPNNLEHWTIEWSVAGTTQNSYRVAIVNNGTNEQLSTTGWVVSVATSYVVALPTDVEWRIEVTVRHSGVASNTGTRLITRPMGHR